MNFARLISSFVCNVKMRVKKMKDFPRVNDVTMKKT